MQAMAATANRGINRTSLLSVLFRQPRASLSQRARERARETKMTDFLLLYQNGDPNWMDNKTPEEMGKQMQAWGDWFKQLEASGHLRNPGAALAKGGTVLTRNGNGFQTDATMSEVK